MYVPDSMILSTIHVAMKTLQRKGRFCGIIHVYCNFIGIQVGLQDLLRCIQLYLARQIYPKKPQYM